MGQKATKFSMDCAVIITTMADEDKTYSPKFKKMRKQYMTAMSPGDSNDDVVARMQKNKGKTLSKEDQLRDELALTVD